MPLKYFVLLSPAIFFLSVPITLLAALTTSFAFFALSIRALLVYVELALVLIQNHLSPLHAFNRRKPHAQTLETLGQDSHDARRRTLLLRRQGSSSAVSTTSTTETITPMTAPADLLAAGLGGYGPIRDFEGVGGWRSPGPEEQHKRYNDNGNSSDDDEGDDDMINDYRGPQTSWPELYTSRLEIPSPIYRRRHHHRSQTSENASFHSSRTLPSASLHTSPTKTFDRSAMSRAGSPELYYRSRPSSKSTSSLDVTTRMSSGSRPRLSNASSNSSGQSSSSKQLHFTAVTRIAPNTATAANG